MRIWILNHYAVPFSGSSGTRHASLAKYLIQRGHNTTIFASPTSHIQNDRMVIFKNGEVYADQFHENIRFRYIKTVEYRNNIQRMLNMISFRSNVLKSTKGLDKPDVIIGSCVHLHAADAGRKLAKKYDVPFIYEIRDIWPETLKDIGKMGNVHPVYLYLRSIELRLYRNADRIVTLLPGSISYLKNHGVSEDNIVYIPNGISVDLYPEPQPVARKNEFIAMFFGAHGPANGLDTIIRAAGILQNDKMLNHIKIHLIGDGTSKQDLIKLKENMGLKNIFFFDQMKKKQLFVNAQNADTFIFHLKDMPVLQRYGISANKLFDYLMCGRPVVFACNSYNDPVKEAGAGISIPPNNPDALVNALVQLSEYDIEKRIEMGTNGRAWVMKHHNLSTLSHRMEDMLNSVVKN